MPRATPAPLELRDLHAWYGESHVLHGMSLSVPAGEIVTLIGRNGMGKTTTLKAILGIGPRWQGSVRLRGHETLGWPAHRIARLGLGYCPEERGIFASLSVRENLLLPPVLGPGGLSLAEIETLFPVLRARAATRGTALSGGEQQMLAIARLLRTGADLLLLDEPTEGLAPVIVRQIDAVLGRLKARGFTMLLVEQNFAFAAGLADRHYVVEHGRVIDMVEKTDLARARGRLMAYLGV